MGRLSVLQTIVSRSHTSCSPQPWPLTPDTLVNNWRARFNVLRFHRESEAVTWHFHSPELTCWSIPGSKPNLRENRGEQRYVLVVRDVRQCDSPGVCPILFGEPVGLLHSD